MFLIGNVLIACDSFVGIFPIKDIPMMCDNSVEMFLVVNIPMIYACLSENVPGLVGSNP